MPFFTPEQAAALAETTVRASSLVEMQFASGTMRVWNGFGDLVTGGQTYKGLGGLGSIDGLETLNGTQSSRATLTLATGDKWGGDMLAKAQADTAEVQGRIIVLSMQLFTDEWQPQGAAIPYSFGVMQPLKVSRTAYDENGNAVRSVTLPVENLFYSRARTPAGRYTDRDQKFRHPGDDFFLYTPRLVNTVFTWPSF